MTPLEAQQYLHSFINYELDLHRVPPQAFGLERIARILAALGNPQQGLRFIHVAGTKGKGSTCAFTAEILRRAGYRVGLFTSPHLLHWRERIRILNPAAKAPELSAGLRDDLFPDMISEVQAAERLTEIRLVVEQMPEVALTYFEALTVLAFCFFRREKADFVVLETGLGGRLDATNIVDALVCAITPVSLEHTRQLGDTIAAIAAEKAGIIKGKPGATRAVVIAPQPPESWAVIERRCRDLGIKMICLGKEIQYGLTKDDPAGQNFWVTTSSQRYELFSRLLGEHQRINAAAAVGIVEVLAAGGVVISSSAVSEGIAGAVWPGRFEIFPWPAGRGGCSLILDAAHNPASAAQLAATISAIFPGRRVVLILAVSVGKDWQGICRALFNVAGRIILTRAQHPRAMQLTGGDVREFLHGQPVHEAASVEEALIAASQDVRPGDVVVVTGSIFIVGEARMFWAQRERAGES